jgi:hypothetical protein
VIPDLYRGVLFGAQQQRERVVGLVPPHIGTGGFDSVPDAAFGRQGAGVNAGPRSTAT